MGLVQGLNKLADYLVEGSLTEVVTDASPTCLGGYLVEYGHIEE